MNAARAHLYVTASLAVITAALASLCLASAHTGAGIIRYLAKSFVMGAEATVEIIGDRGSAIVANRFLGITWGER